MSPEMDLDRVAESGRTKGTACVNALGIGRRNVRKAWLCAVL